MLFFTLIFFRIRILLFTNFHSSLSFSFLSAPLCTSRYQDSIDFVPKWNVSKKNKDSLFSFFITHKKNQQGESVDCTQSTVKDKEMIFFEYCFMKRRWTIIKLWLIRTIESSIRIKVMIKTVISNQSLRADETQVHKDVADETDDQSLDDWPWNGWK